MKAIILNFNNGKTYIINVTKEYAEDDLKNWAENKNINLEKYCEYMFVEKLNLQIE